MSKKITTTPSGKRSQRIRLRHRESRRKSKRRSPPIPETFRLQIANAQKPFRLIRVPPSFSLLRNYTESITCIKDVRRSGERAQNVRLDFSMVTDIGVEAVAALLATIEFYNQYSNVEGNLPQDNRCRDILVQSDFLSRTTVAHSMPVQRRGRIAKKQSNRVAPETARELIRHTTSIAFGSASRKPAAQRALLEGMQNTFDHAVRQNKGEAEWIAVAYADAEQRRISFVLVDSGVGIFKSVRISKMRSVFRAVGIEQNTAILRDLLARRIPSSTGLSYRGRGLPSFKDAAERGTIRNVVFLSNDVFANISTDDYQRVSDEFDGTLLYWEIE